MEVGMDEVVKQAIQDLQIDVPVMSWQVQDGKVVLSLYGGRVLEWAKAPAGAPEKGPAKAPVEVPAAKPRSGKK